jgi:hypothetical protein
MSTPMTSMNQDTTHIVNITEGEFSRSFEIRKMNILKSAMVSKEFAAVVLPVISGLKVGAQGADTASVDSFLKSALTFDVGASVEAVCEALSDMEEARLEKLLLNLFCTTSVIGHDGSTRLPMSSIDLISKATEYDHGILVKLALEVAEYCLPFGHKVKSLIGAGMQAITSFGNQTVKGDSTSKPLEPSDTSETT